MNRGVSADPADDGVAVDPAGSAVPGAADRWGSRVRLADVCIRTVLLAFALALASCDAPVPDDDPGVTTAMGKSPEENVRDYGIPAIVVPFDWAVPEGMIVDPGERMAMIEAKGLCEEAIESAHHLSSHPFRSDDPDLSYEHPILVLVGPGCGSACDHLVHLLSQFPSSPLSAGTPMAP